jgi:glyoxylase-like metal-dependent hydrolase (beta-lactamase superfamily II)
MEVMPHIHQLKVPLPNNSLGFTNSYLVKTEAGCLLIDTGWNADESFNSLQDQLRGARVDWPDLKYILITHAHPDHYGLVERIVPLTHAKLIIHRIEDSLLQSRFLDAGSFKQERDEWMRINGVGDEERPKFETALLEMLATARQVTPDILVTGGEQLQLGEDQFEIIWTPGHSPGHICLYYPDKRLFFSGDHVLPSIIPSVGMDTQSFGIPLAGYLKAMQQVKGLPVDLVLPGHGDVFKDLSGRAAEIEEHHAERIREAATAIGSGAFNADQVTGLISWPTLGASWEKLPYFIKRITVAETISHLEFGFAQGAFDKVQREGMIFYSNKI